MLLVREPTTTFRCAVCNYMVLVKAAFEANFHFTCLFNQLVVKSRNLLQDRNGWFPLDIGYRGFLARIASINRDIILMSASFDFNVISGVS